MAKMIQSAEEFVELRTSENPELYTRAAQETAPEEVWLDVITRFPEMRVWVAHNKTIQTAILKILATDSDWRVRHMVASKRKTEPVILEQLAKDIDEGVRLAVAKNPKTPLHILEMLVHDQWETIAKEAKERIEQNSFKK